MKKKLTCLLLIAALALSSFALFSCGEKSQGSNTSSRLPMTLSLWLPTQEGTTPAAIAQVEAALNKITKAQYNTAIELHAITDGQYEAAVSDRITTINDIQTRTEAERKAQKQAEREARKRGETIAVTTVAETTAAETEETDEVLYPSVTSTQMDIFLIRGYEDFMKYAEDNKLSAIDDDLNGSAKLIKSYVYPTLLEQATLYDATYAVPNNHPVGEYTYLLINKELCDSYYYDPADMTSIVNCRDFILDVSRNSKVTPLLSEVETPGLRYWSPDGSESILATIILDDSDPKSKLNIRNIYGLKSYVKTVSLMKELKEKGCIGNNPDAAEFGVGVIKGTSKDLEKYNDKYYVNVLAKPRAGQEDIYQAMFAVSAYTKDVKRSMEIMTLINTDKTFRTILQYGVEGVHWAIDNEKSTPEDPVIKILSNDYKMNLVETGNVFITYPGEGLPVSAWADGIQQNLDSILDPLCRFKCTVDETNQKYYDKLTEETKTIFGMVDKMTSEEFEAQIETLKDKVNDSDAYFYLLDDKATEFESLITTYTNYYNQFFGR